MALATIAVNPIQQFALARGANHFSNPRYGAFLGRTPTRMFAEEAWDNFKRGDIKYTASGTSLTSIEPSIPGVNHWLFNTTTSTITFSVISVQATYTEFTLPMPNITGASGLVMQANEAWEIGDVFRITSSTPNPTLDVLWKVTTVTPASPNQTVRAVKLGVPYTQPTDIVLGSVFTQIYKHNQLVPTSSLTAASIDYNHVFAGVSTSAYTFLGWSLSMDATGDFGLISYGLSDGDGAYARLRIPASAGGGRSRLTTVDVLERRTGTYSGIGEFDIGAAEWTFTARVKYLTSSSTEGWFIVGPHRTHNAEWSSIQDETALTVAFDSVLCFVATTAFGNENWHILMHGLGPNQAAEFIQRIPTSFSSSVVRDLKITSNALGTRLNFYIDNTLVYTAIDSPLRQVIVNSHNRGFYDNDTAARQAITNESMWVGAEIRGNVAGVVSDVTAAIYSMVFTNNKAYLRTGIQLLKKLK